MTRALLAAACFALVASSAVGCGGHDAAADASTPGPESATGPDTSVDDGSSDAAPDATVDGPLLDGSVVDTAASPPQDAGPDVPGVCPATCATSADCQNGCQPAFLTLYCCDVTTGTCFIGQDGIQHCPLHPNGDASVRGCLPTGCPAGQMCVTYSEVDPPAVPVPSCFALPAACANAPTCGCLAEAGVCGPDGGPYVPSCDGLDGAALNCNAF